MTLTIRQLLRFAALFLILIILLTCYQFLGNAMLQAFFPSRGPAIWLFLTSPTPIDGTDSRYKEVNQADAEFTVIAPPGSHILFSVNRSEIEPRRSGLDPTMFHVTLREGLNDVRVGMSQSDGAAFSNSASMQVLYRPEHSSTPVLLTEPYLNEQKHLNFALFTSTASANNYSIIVGAAPATDLWPRTSINFVDVPDPDNAPVYLEFSHDRERLRWQIWPLPAHQIGGPSSASPTTALTVVPDRIKRELQFNVDKEGSLSLEGSLFVPKQAQAVEWVQQGQIAPPELFNDYFALSFNLWVTGEPVSAQTFNEMVPFFAWDDAFTRDFIPKFPIDSTMAVSGNQITLRAEAKVPKTGLEISTLHEGTMPFGNEDRIIVKVANRSSVDFFVPITWNGDTAELTLTNLRPGQRLIRIYPARGTTQTEQATGEGNPRQDPGNYFVLNYFRDVQEIVPYNFRAALTALVGAVPFIWILVLISKAQLPEDVKKQLAAACVVFLVLHFTIRSLDILNISLGSLHLARLFGKPELAWTLSQLGTYYPYLAVATIILLRPIFNAYRKTALVRKKSLWRSLGRGIVLVLFLAISVCLAVFLQFGPRYSITGFRPGDPEIVILGAAAACVLLWVPLRIAIVSLLDIPLSKKSVFLANLAIIALAAVPPMLEFALRKFITSYVQAFHAYPFFLPWPTVGGWWRWIVALLGAILLFEVIRLAVRISSWHKGIHFVNSKQGRWLLLPLMIAAIPAWYASSALAHPGATPGLYDFSNFAYQFDSVLPYAVLPAIILLIRRLNRRDEYLISPAVISAGSLLFAYYLCGQNITVLFIPLPMLLGYFLFRYFLIRLAVESRPPDVSRGLAAFLEMKSRESSGRQRKKALGKKFEQGELSTFEFNRGMSQVDNFINSAIDHYSSARASKHMDAFALGPEKGPWHSAMSSIKYGLIISIPFQLFALAKTLNRPAGNFPVIYLALSILQTLALWAVVSFLFGYFFHAIRGSNGFQKALNFLIALSLPTILLQLMITNQAPDTIQLLQLVQLASFVLLLALIGFDVQLLQRHGFSWRDLPTAYGVTTSAAYLGTVGLSLVSTIIEPAIHDWIMHLLKLK